MEKYISLSALRANRFDEALKRLGYVRASSEMKILNISQREMNKRIKEGYYKDTFVVNNVRYVLPHI